MFETVLIANRGEIACRVIRTARAMGLRTVAVHSDVDAGALHVGMADAAVSLGGAAPAESYLRGDAIIEAALATGAQAIHPGYGFLSENPDFAEACAAADLVFVGPSAEAMRAMGLKDAAKAAMEAAGVPVVPGYHGSDQADDVLAKAASDIGYPVLIKAVAGGGGKGMRLVENADAFADALRAARAEAKGAFGNDAVLVEKFVAKPRHIEVQVFGDGTRAVHLFERDCSLQRRHQKVIEEAPAPGMTEEMREAMGAAAVRAAEAIGYSGAGTVEFIVDASEGLRPDGFYFMEMNTRLQVEHPVTEEITGVDLVEWQLRVASGESLPVRQEDLSIHGHAFEARLYAEDVPAGFLPATGTLSHLSFPEDARAETGVRAGDEISPWYDPMIAKVVVHGATRAIALKKLSRALARTEVAGTVTNLRFLLALAAHPGMVSGDVDTGLIGRDIDALTVAPEVPGTAIALGAMALAGVLEADDPLTGFSLWAPLRRTVEVEVEGERVSVCLEVSGPDATDLYWGDTRIEARRLGGAWRIGGRPAPTHAVAGDTVTVFVDAGHAIRAVDPLAVGGDTAAAKGVIEAPMPGLVRAVHVKTGDRVEEGAPLAVLEAMKMEHVMKAGRAGVVAEVPVAEGAQVAAGDILIRLEDDA
ncbi:acetyl/propionyl/methylcrotonyl-CoA carboxylase subunit alpha [Pseudaestuariivita atlantica]|uniref:3-methylcrotonyl-CoA carboxylase n=1 Tax=Pseudaestuariivita atlantica TaxID=1317121 RepID=A0A0L1JRI3_9RHOB|nr:biotin carboxylase N-terminal domain-containing protein [Pseudaestuariivita atlantica]KNG94409.1 3-methylcrotonyl-CoA carboxylase [Pseudaestuariivita atlantica]